MLAPCVYMLPCCSFQASYAPNAIIAKIFTCFGPYLDRHIGDSADEQPQDTYKHMQTIAGDIVHLCRYQLWIRSLPWRVCLQ